MEITGAADTETVEQYRHRHRPLSDMDAEIAALTNKAIATVLSATRPAPSSRA
jgi:hypothetical protein